jgi:hypothetical protein
MTRNVVLGFFKDHDKGRSYTPSEVAHGLGKPALRHTIGTHLWRLARDGEVKNVSSTPHRPAYKLVLNAPAKMAAAKAAQPGKPNGNGAISNTEHALEARLKDIHDAAEMLKDMSEELLGEYRKVRETLGRLL